MADELRFEIGARVQCNVGEWEPGTVVRQHYRERDWPAGKTAAYQVRRRCRRCTCRCMAACWAACLTQVLCCIMRQVKLDSGSLIYAPSDNDRFVKLLLGVPDTPTDRLLARERAGWVEQEDMPADSEESSSAPTMSWDDIANWDKPPSYPPPYPPNHDDCDEDERSDWPRQDWTPGEKGSGHGLSLEIEGRPMRNAHHPDGTRGLVTAEEFARLERLRLNTPHYDAMVRACVHWQGPLSECRCYVCRLDGRYVDAEDSDESISGGDLWGGKKLVPPPDVTFQEMLAKPGTIEMLKGHIGKESAYLAPFCTEKGSIYQDRLGTDIGKATQKKTRFCRGPARGGHPLCNPAGDGARLQRAAAGSRRWPGWCARKLFFAPLYTKNPNLCQDRLGTNS